MKTMQYYEWERFYRFTEERIVKSPENWQDFLGSMAYRYLLPFWQQIGIYFQKPDAVELDTYTGWKNKGRQVVRNSKSISLFSHNGNNVLRLFDISSTRSVSKNIPEFSVWTISEKEAVYLREQLGSLDDLLMNTLQNNKDMYKSFIIESVKFIINERCDFSLLSVDDKVFENLPKSVNDLHRVGATISFASNEMLEKIEKTLADYKKIEYDIIRDNISKNNKEVAKNGRNEIDIPTGRGLLSSEYNIPRNRGGGANNKVGNDEVNIYSGKETSVLSAVVPNRSDSETFSRNSAEGEEDGRRTDSENGENRGSKRGIESQRPNEMGSVDEQYSQQGSGNSESRSNIQLNLFDAIKDKEQSQKGSALLCTSITEQDIEMILKKGSSFENGKYRIMKAYTELETAKDRAEFLKKEYGIGGGTLDFLDDWGGFSDYDSKGLKISKYITPDHRYLDDNVRAITILKWNDIEKRIGALIKNNSYLDANEVDIYNQEYLLRENLNLNDVIDNDNRKDFEVSEQSYVIPAEVLSNMPDTITIDERNQYGYTADELLPISKEKALEFWDNNVISIFLLYDDDTESMAYNRESIENFNGMFGVETEDWIRHINQLSDKSFSQQVDEVYAVHAEKSTITASEITVGDMFELNGRVYTVESLQSIYPNDTDTIGVSHSEMAGEMEYDVTQSMSRRKLVDEGRYIGNIQRETKGINANINLVPQNYKIKDTEIVKHTPKENYRNNIAAIKTLISIENENRQATPEEQEILAKYVGWGGLADAFDESKWSKEYSELQGLLTSEEYNAARESTLNAHYTAPVVINAMYQVISNLNFQTGNILEPSMGIGNFFGMLPEQMKDSTLYGVELDNISGKIAKQLYPKADIQIKGFEKTGYTDNTFDIVIGNIPFGDYRVNDRAYNKYNFQIHDYFVAKSIDKVRAGGIVAVITSKGTLDKKDVSARKYFAERAELLGAVRLPNIAFKNAGTEVTSDILFFQKRESVLEITQDNRPEWLDINANSDGILINKYFINHPEMVVGEIKEISGRFGMETACILADEDSFERKLNEAIGNIKGEIPDIQIAFDDEIDEQSIPADPNVRNFSYTIVDNNIYYRIDSIMKKMNFNATKDLRVRGLVELRDITRNLIDLQLEDATDDVIKSAQNQLNKAYDDYIKQYGYISTQANKLAMQEDSSYPLLCSLEKFDSEGKYIGKADMFSKRTIKNVRVVERVDTPAEALSVCLSEKGRVDIEYMAKLCDNTTVDDIISRSKGIIFLNPVTNNWESNDEYLSGNVKSKLKVAELYAKDDSRFLANVEALKTVQPPDLTADEIQVRLGATWLDPKYINQFMKELLNVGDNVTAIYTPQTAEWYIKNKNYVWGNVLVNTTYGIPEANALHILENALNLRSMTITEKDYQLDKYVVNKEATKNANMKQQELKEAFNDWIFTDINRRDEICKVYNEKFNATRPREYDGSHLSFIGMNPEITLKDHQRNAVAHTLYGDNTLLAHCVGAGKTYEMATSAMECKRLGICEKSLFVVPNHLTEQWASEFLQLYPGANLLVATKKDFTPTNRKKFCSRIATGNWDAVIIGHSQFEKIPISLERQEKYARKEINDITDAIEQLQRDGGDKASVKSLEKTRKSLITKLEKLMDTPKDDVVTFEQLGIDRLYVDESHNYKNLFLYTKMTNVAGISTTEAKKSTDMFQKCRYIDEITGGKGITFATGTPISNSMTELYTNMKYLQYGTLINNGLLHFDAWASTFGETTTATELKPEGTGYRLKTRFSKFFNLPELMSMFKDCADIQTSDMLNLPVPDVEYHNEVLKPSDIQKNLILSLADRAEVVRNNEIDVTVDNMLKITNDGRKIALDQRLFNEVLPEFENSKINKCVENAFNLYKKYESTHSAQLIFCDLSTPKNDGHFNVYDDLKNKLIDKGVLSNEIAFIHSANTETKKKELFSKVRSGKIRFLIGSTAKMGAGTNVQDRLIALHHLDVPWRPSDIEQQEGRILRQGNMHNKVHIYRYVTEGTFDSYSWQLIENKQKFISQIMTSKSPVRAADDIDEATLTYAEVKALATGNPLIKEKMDLDIKISRLSSAKANYNKQKYKLENDIYNTYPTQISKYKDLVLSYNRDISLYNSNYIQDNFKMLVNNKVYTKSIDAHTAILNTIKISGLNGLDQIKIGEFCGFDLKVSFSSISNIIYLSAVGATSHSIELGTSAQGNAVRFNNLFKNMSENLSKLNDCLVNLEHQLEIAKIEVDKPFKYEKELKEAQARLIEVENLIDSAAEQSDRNKNLSPTDELNEHQDGQQLNGLKDFIASAQRELDRNKNNSLNGAIIQRNKDNIGID